MRKQKPSRRTILLDLRNDNTRTYIKYKIETMNITYKLEDVNVTLLIGKARFLRRFVALS